MPARHERAGRVYRNDPGVIGNRWLFADPDLPRVGAPFSRRDSPGGRDAPVDSPMLAQQSEESGMGPAHDQTRFGGATHLSPSRRRPPVCAASGAERAGDVTRPAPDPAACSRSAHCTSERRGKPTPASESCRFRIGAVHACGTFPASMRTRYSGSAVPMTERADDGTRPRRWRIARLLPSRPACPAFRCARVSAATPLAWLRVSGCGSLERRYSGPRYCP